jgi:hypothetical protein
MLRAGAMRRVLVLALAGLISALGVASCGEGGTGVGTAPSPPGPCPGTPPTGACSKLQVCAYPVCPAGAVTCPTTETLAYCPGPNGTWQITTRGDGGMFTDAVIPEISVDTAGDSPEASSEASTDAVTDGDAPLDSSAPSDSMPDSDAAD